MEESLCNGPCIVMSSSLFTYILSSLMAPNHRKMMISIIFQESASAILVVY
jgi:hypothetical protein